MTEPCIELCAKAKRLDQRTLLDGLAQVLGFADYFGHNLDAAWDALTEIEWPKTHLNLLLDARTKEVVEADLRVFIDLLDEAKLYWLAENKQLELIVLR